MRVRLWSFYSVFLCLYLFLTCITATSAVFAEEIRIDELIYAGIGEDRVGTSQTKPDGIPDARFYIGLEVPGSVEINEIRVFVADQNGGKGGEYWVTRPGAGWFLGVVSGGKFVKTKFADDLGSFQGSEKLELRGTDSGRLGAHTHFLLEIAANGKNFSRLVSAR